MSTDRNTTSRLVGFVSISLAVAALATYGGYVIGVDAGTRDAVNRIRAWGTTPPAGSATQAPAPGPARVGGPGRLSWSRLGRSVSWLMPDDARIGTAIVSQGLVGERGTFGHSTYDPGRYVQTLQSDGQIIYSGGVAYQCAKGFVEAVSHRACQLNDRGGLYIARGAAGISIDVIPPLDGIRQADLFIDADGRAFDPRTQRPDRIEAHLAGDTVLIWSADETDAADETDDPTGGLTGPAVRR